jgi:hypothetical protein
MQENTAEFYRREADNLLSKITALSDPNQQAELLQMARFYVKLAHRMARDEELPAIPEALASA